jgi:hypothetical protein
LNHFRSGVLTSVEQSEAMVAGGATLGPGGTETGVAPPTSVVCEAAGVVVDVEGGTELVGER